jgi:hypothetical protein
MPRRPPRFGDVWAIKGGVLGPEPWLIVSNDLYLELNEDNMLAVPIRDTNRPGSRVVTEPISDGASSAGSHQRVTPNLAPW